MRYFYYLNGDALRSSHKKGRQYTFLKHNKTSSNNQSSVLSNIFLYSIGNFFLMYFTA